MRSMVIGNSMQNELTSMYVNKTRDYSVFNVVVDDDDEWR